MENDVGDDVGSCDFIQAFHQMAAVEHQLVAQRSGNDDHMQHAVFYPAAHRLPVDVFAHHIRPEGYKALLVGIVVESRRVEKLAHHIA